MFSESAGLARTPIAAVIKAAPTLLRLGALDTPMPAAFRNSVGLLVEVHQTGWPSLDGRTFKVAAWQDGAAASFPDLTLAASDTTAESGAVPPRDDAFVIIRAIPQNFGRY